MRKNATTGSLRSLVDAVDEPLGQALPRLRVVRLEIPGTLPHWLTSGPVEKRALVEGGAPRGRIWTVRELESLPWDEHPLTLQRCVAAFQAAPRPEPTPEAPHA